MASTTKATRAAGATLGMGCLTDIEYGNGLSGDVTLILGGTELYVKCCWLFTFINPVVSANAWRALEWSYTLFVMDNAEHEKDQVWADLCRESGWVCRICGAVHRT